MSAVRPNENQWSDSESSESSSETSSVQTEEMLKWRYPTHSSFIVDKNNPPKYEFSSDTEDEANLKLKYLQKMRAPSMSGLNESSKVYHSESMAHGEGIRVYNSGSKVYNAGSEVFRQGLKAYNSNSKVYNEGSKEYYNERSKKYFNEGSKKMYNQESREVYKAEAKETYSAEPKSYTNRSRERGIYDPELANPGSKNLPTTETNKASNIEEANSSKVSANAGPRSFTGELKDGFKANVISQQPSLGYQSPIYSTRPNVKKSFLSSKRLTWGLAGAIGLVLLINVILTSVVLQKVSRQK